MKRYRDYYIRLCDFKAFNYFVGRIEHSGRDEFEEAYSKAFAEKLWKFSRHDACEPYTWFVMKQLCFDFIRDNAYSYTSNSWEYIMTSMRLLWDGVRMQLKPAGIDLTECLVDAMADDKISDILYRRAHQELKTYLNEYSDNGWFDCSADNFAGLVLDYTSEAMNDFLCHIKFTGPHVESYLTYVYIMEILEEKM